MISNSDIKNLTIVINSTESCPTFQCKKYCMKFISMIASHTFKISEDYPPWLANDFALG